MIILVVTTMTMTRPWKTLSGLAIMSPVVEVVVLVQMLLEEMSEKRERVPEKVVLMVQERRCTFFSTLRALSE
jgi:hypothetical protein